MAIELDGGFRLVGTPAPPAAAQALRMAAGLSPTSDEQAARAIAGSWAGCHVLAPASEEVVAMGRVIGDGGWYFHVVDMATRPDFQGRGLGGSVLDHLLAEIRERAPEDAYVNLLADPPGRRLYLSRGFLATAPDQVGMSLRL